MVLANDVDCRTQPGTEDTDLRECREVTTGVGILDSASMTMPKPAVGRSPKREFKDIVTAVDSLATGNTIAVTSQPANSVDTSSQQGSSQHEPIKFWRGDPVFPIVTRTRPRSQTADNSIAGTETTTAVEDDENPFRTADKPLAPPREKELGVHNTYSELLRPPSGRRSLNVPNLVDYGGLECIQRYRARHGVRQDDLSTDVDPSDLIPISSPKRGAGSTSDPNDWHAGQPLIFRKADS